MWGLIIGLIILVAIGVGIYFLVGYIRGTIDDIVPDTDDFLPFDEIQKEIEPYDEPKEIS